MVRREKASTSYGSKSTSSVDGTSASYIGSSNIVDKLNENENNTKLKQKNIKILKNVKVIKTKQQQQAQERYDEEEGVPTATTHVSSTTLASSASPSPVISDAELCQSSEVSKDDPLVV